MLEIGERPWGQYFVLLDDVHCKVKRIFVEPHQRLSYQYHMYRSEVWTIVEGTALVTLNEEEITLYAGDVIKIPVESRHRIKNNGDTLLIFVEVQLGSYFGEDDIIRIQDDYNRSEDI